MSTTDEILHGGAYTDRRGRRWIRTHRNNWSSPRPPRVSAIADEWQIRLLIERDQHRDVCLGLWECTDHPVPRVAVIESDYGSFARNSRVYDQHGTHSEAMDAARALAVTP